MKATWWKVKFKLGWETGKGMAWWGEGRHWGVGGRRGGGRGRSTILAEEAKYVRDL